LGIGEDILLEDPSPRRGAAVGLLAWFWPGLVGGGDAITQRTRAGEDGIMVVGFVFLVRFGLGPVS